MDGWNKRWVGKELFLSTRGLNIVLRSIMNKIESDLKRLQHISNWLQHPPLCQIFLLWQDGSDIICQLPTLPLCPFHALTRSQPSLSHSIFFPLMSFPFTYTNSQSQNLTPCLPWSWYKIKNATHQVPEAFYILPTVNKAFVKAFLRPKKLFASNITLIKPI